MITLNFAFQCNANKIQDIELPDYKAFFDFYLANFDKGIIFNVLEVSE